MTIQFLSQNKFDEAAISASSEATGLPASNLQDELREVKWRATGKDSEYIDIDFGSGGDYCNTLAVIQHNLSYTAQIELLVSDVAPGGAELLDETWDVYDSVFGAGEGLCGENGAGGVLTDDATREELLAGMMFWKSFTQTNGRYWRVKFLDPDNADGYVEAGRVMLGVVFTPQYNFAYNWEFYPIDESLVVESKGGQKYTDVRAIRYGLKLKFKHIQDNERYWGFIDLFRRYGVRRDILLILSPDGTPAEQLFTTLYGRFTGLPKLPKLNNYTYGQTETTIVFEESL